MNPLTIVMGALASLLMGFFLNRHSPKKPIIAQVLSVSRLSRWISFWTILEKPTLSALLKDLFGPKWAGNGIFCRII